MPDGNDPAKAEALNESAKPHTKKLFFPGTMDADKIADIVIAQIRDVEEKQ